MKKSILSFLAIAAAIAAMGQSSTVIPKNIRAENTLDRLFDFNGLSRSELLWGIPMEPAGVVGDAYIAPEWKRTTIMLYDKDKMIEAVDVRYEIQLDQLEIRTDKGVKVLSGRRVKSFVWVDSLTNVAHYFVNAKDYKTDDNVANKGFYEVLTEGDRSLLARTEVAVKQPTYVVQLDIGERDARILKRTKYYYLENDVVRELPSSRKKLPDVFGEQADAAEKFIKLNRLSLNDPVHLKSLFDHCNAQAITN